MMIDRYQPTGRPVTAHQREVLTILMEECAEVIQACSKIIRFGADDGYPGSTETNVESLSKELGEVQLLTEMAMRLMLARGPTIHNAKLAKAERLARFMQTADQ